MITFNSEVKVRWYSTVTPGAVWEETWKISDKQDGRFYRRRSKYIPRFTDIVYKLTEEKDRLCCYIQRNIPTCKTRKNPFSSRMIGHYDVWGIRYGCKFKRSNLT